MGMRPHLMGVTSPDHPAHCRCGGAQTLTVILWEVDDGPFSVSAGLTCVECGKNEHGAPRR